MAMHLHLYPSPTAAADGAAAVAVGTGSATDTYGNTWRVSSTGQAVEVSSTRDPPLQFVSLTDAAWRTVETPPSAAAFVGVMPDVSWAPLTAIWNPEAPPPLFFSFSGWCSLISAQPPGMQEAGFIWLASETQLWVLSPRAAGSGPVEAGVGHSGQPAPNGEDPEWRLCPDAEALLAPLLPLRGLQRSFMDVPAVVLVGSNMNLELSVQTSGEPRLTPPVSMVRCLCLPAAACAP